MLPIFKPPTFPELFSKLPALRAILPWGAGLGGKRKQTTTSVKKQKSIALLRSHRGIPRQPTVRMPPLMPRKRASDLGRSPSEIYRRAAELRAKRANNRNKKPLAPKPTTAPPQVPPRTYTPPNAETSFNFEQGTLKDKFNYAFKKTRGTSRPRIQAEKIFFHEMNKLNFRHALLTENFENLVRLDEAAKLAGEREKEAAEHDARAKELREKLKQQATPEAAWKLNKGPPPVMPNSRPPRYSAPKSLAAVSPSTRILAADQVLKDAAVWQAHRARINAGEIPPDTPFPNLRRGGSLYEQLDAGKDPIWPQVREERMREARRGWEERHQEEKVCAEEMAHAEEKARAEDHAQAHLQKREQELQEQIRRAWYQRMNRESALAKEVKAAEEEDAPGPFATPAIDQPAFVRWDRYRRAWAALKGEIDEEIPAPLVLSQLPWPQFNDIFSLDDFNPEAIKIFLLNHRRPGFKAVRVKQRLRHELLLYHPDKFNVRVLPHVAEDQREIVSAAATLVTIILQDLIRFVVARGG
ncbi:hypothetical protein GYMLUDRAFT_67335 [Collybiopsis luxurians FD-317 M1]|nr:hypothetical protein GYMLUDRAFT_67335 [Collybiopsis luxurians FD-317 M1]